MSGSPHSDRTPIRLTRRGRAVVIGFAATVTLVLLWLTVGPGAFAAPGKTAKPSTRHKR